MAEPFVEETSKLFDEIAGVRTITREGSLTFVVLNDKWAGPCQMSVSGKSSVPVPANLSLTGPGFVSGFHDLKIAKDLIQHQDLRRWPEPVADFIQRRTNGRAVHYQPVRPHPSAKALGYSH